MSMAYLDYGPWVRVSTFRSVFIVPVPAIRVYLSTHLGTAFTLNRNHDLFEQLGELKMYLRQTATDINGSKKGRCQALSTTAFTATCKII